MKSLTDTLKTLITEHSLDILQQEQRLKAMLADLLPHDKQMRFLLELSLRAQIPQKLIAQQNETRVGWEAQIKSLKHYFQDEYFLEDKAVNSVFDCWVDVLPRKKQVAAPPKLGNLNADSKFKDIGAINWVRLAFTQNANWKEFFEESKITNYKSFFNDIGVIKHANHISSYPKLVLPKLLQNEIAKQPPLLFDYESLRESKSLFSYIESNISSEDWSVMIKLLNENRKKELSEYIAKKGLNSYFDLKTEIKKLEEERDSIKGFNADKTKTLNFIEFKSIGSSIGLDFSMPAQPKYPNKPSLAKANTTFTKDVYSITFKFFLVLTAIVSIVIFINIKWTGFKEWLFFFHALMVFLYMLSEGSWFDTDTWIYKYQKNISFDRKEVERIVNENQNKHEQNVLNYTNVLLPKYKNELTKYDNKIAQQIKDLNEAFPFIARQIWLQAMVTSSNVVSQGNSSNTGEALQKLVSRLALLYPNNLKVDMKFLNFQSEINLIFNNKIWINIEVNEPYNRETRQETHFIGSNDEKRDGIFTDNNWFVLRFSESQVSYVLSECIAIVQELVKFTQNGNTQHLINLTQLSKGIETLCWTKEEARLMAMNED